MKKADVTLSWLTPELIDPAAAFYHQIWHETQAEFQDSRVSAMRSQQFFRERLIKWLPNTVVARQSENIIGIVCWQSQMLEALYVGKAGRSLGLGSQLLKIAEDEMADSSGAQLQLDCLVGNFVARRFYERNHWNVTRTVAHWTEAVGGRVEVMAWLMEKNLGGT